LTAAYFAPRAARRGEPGSARSPFPARAFGLVDRGGQGTWRSRPATRAADRFGAQPQGIVDFATASHLRAASVLLVVALLGFLPGFFSTPPIDRDEARFAQATKQMIESGDYIDIRFQDEVRYKKPVGIYWLQAAVVNTAKTLGLRSARPRSGFTDPVAHRRDWRGLLTYWAALAFVSRRAAVLAALMMATCVLLASSGSSPRTDAMLLATTVAAMARWRGPISLRRTRRQSRPTPGRSWRCFWTALAVGVLLKGPLIIMVAGLAIVALAVVDRSLRWLLALKPLSGLVWFAVLVLPWFLAIIDARARHSLRSRSGQDLASKLFSGQESHGAPPGTYFVLFWFTFWPGATLAALATPAVWAARLERATKFCSPGSCHRGSCWNWSSPSCRTTCCRFIQRSQS
jgi:4-amino-4-deoxy-L-arabinose transferase-like glycosyltransferase